MIGLFAFLAVALFIQTQQIIVPLVTNLNGGITEARATEVGEWLNGKITEINVVAQRKGVKEMDYAKIKDQLSEFNNSEPDFEYLLLAYPDGHGYDTDGKEQNLSLRDFFKAVFREGKAVFVGQPSISPITKNAVINIAVAVKNSSGELSGCIAGALKLSKLD